MKTYASRIVPLFAATILAASISAAAANLGAYTGTIDITGSQANPEVKYKARITLTLPVSENKGSSLTAEFLAGEAPMGKMMLTQYDETFTDKQADVDGKTSSYKCVLAQPVELPVTVTGVLNADLKAKRHSLSVTVLAMKTALLKCTSARVAPYTRNQNVSFTMGTGVPGDQDRVKLPFADASRLTAKHTLDPTAYTKGKQGPVVQEWDLKLVK